MLELNEISMTDTASLEILHPKTGKKTDAFIEVYGIHTKHFNKVVKEMATIKKEDDEYTIELLTKCTKSIKGFSKDGVELDTTIENIKEIYSSNPLVRSQVDRFIANQSNFFLNK